MIIKNLSKKLFFNYRRTKISRNNIKKSERIKNKNKISYLVYNNNLIEDITISPYKQTVKYNCNSCKWNHFSKNIMYQHVLLNHPIKYRKKKDVQGKSKGEKKVSSYLQNNNIFFTMEKTFNNLNGIGGRPLRFDFYINEKNKKSLIEYDGEYHFKIIKGRTNIDILKKQQLHDNIKNKYAKKNNIPLLRIPYFEFKFISSKIKLFFNSLKNN